MIIRAPPTAEPIIFASCDTARTVILVNSASLVWLCARTTANPYRTTSAVMIAVGMLQGPHPASQTLDATRRKNVCISPFPTCLGRRTLRVLEHTGSRERVEADIPARVAELVDALS